MKEFDLSKWKEVENFCSHILTNGATLPLKELSHYKQQLVELNVSPTLKVTTAKVEQASQYLHQLIKDKTPWYQKLDYLIPIIIFILTCLFTLWLSQQPEQESSKLRKTTESVLFPSHFPIDNQKSKHEENPALNKSSNSDGNKAAGS